ncbi:hypothetical protein POM88_051362 [Heracleum sosnowskyi]|uniref:Uncharacterized protein n=1 Tax=Heracleum sosnowskyi TaxID=360622 RepID=A0AAD8H243_9APIA|nr:hypothetical protein POM88_051362 [Heracleum sosnowskyi]
MCSAISTLSLGYAPEKKNEWCESIVLLTGMTTQAVRFHVMRSHIQAALRSLRTSDSTTCGGRFEQANINLAMQSRWNKISKAFRRGEDPYIFSYYMNSALINLDASGSYI